jgi:recombinational DNA repair protein (RecF pathway)
MKWVHDVFSEATTPDQRRPRALWVIDRVRVIILHREGRLPSLEHCTACQKRLETEGTEVCFTAERGLLCGQCSEYNTEFPGCGGHELCQLQGLFAGLPFSSPGASAHLNGWLTSLLRQTTGKILKSEAMLEQFLRRGPGSGLP